MAQKMIFIAASLVLLASIGFVQAGPTTKTDPKEQSWVVKKFQETVGEEGIKKLADLHTRFGNGVYGIFKALEDAGIIELRYPEKEKAEKHAAAESKKEHKEKKAAPAKKPADAEADESDD